ncbi:PglL family O-oligosaccharyltransferase [Vibrio sp. SCSIO 43136]|uniref:PglL family O-oligosaccharyltransferase n=1 Tax=Vibrio sp. SCSIO 43136 TaxID=2819101 RepID=UPI0020765F33|nr:PglL family O-oligosaccharyltransferase [Vibrio sp. SCSIO 43136]USD65032.1 PglL family O-oligosaccharyltransferase [Vibrio sp. SCSIO 43136]
MATLHVRGTELESVKVQTPLNRRFLAALGFTFLVSMHFFMPNPGGSGLALSFNATTWITASIAIAIGLYQLSRNQKLKYSKLTVALFLCCLVLTAPITFPETIIEQSLGRLTGLWAGFFLFVTLQQFPFSNKQKQRLLWFIVLATGIEAIICWVQYLYLTPGNMFGYNTIQNRPYGIFQQPNVLASFLATGLVLSAYLLARLPNKYRRKPWHISFLIAIPLLIAPMLVIVSSRTGWLGAVIGIVLILPYLWRFSTKRRFATWTAALVLATGIGIVTPELLGESQNLELLESKTSLTSARQFHFPQTIDMIIEKPFTGYGYGHFESAYMLYTARQHQLNEHYPAGLAALDHPHNELMLWGVEAGLVPVLVILLTAAFITYKITTAREGTRLGMLALFAPLVVHSQLEYPFYHSAIHWISFIVLLFWLDQRTAKYKFAPFSKFSKVLTASSSLVLPIITSFYMLSALHTNYVLTQFEKSQPRQPELLDKVTNPVVWKDRFDRDVYSTYLTIGLYTQDAKLIQPYIDWSLSIIPRKPRPAFYTNLILAYQGMGEEEKARQIQTEAEFLFPNKDFSQVKYQPPSKATSTASAAN